MADKIQLRRDTRERWEQYNPILLSGEIGVELITNNFKIGDGTHRWLELEYAGNKITDELGDNGNLALSQKGATNKLLAKKDIATEYGDDNKKVVAQSLLTSSITIVNVDLIAPLLRDTYTPTTARSAVPKSLRKSGLIITYISGADRVLEQFTISDISKWDISSNWKNLKSDFIIRKFDEIDKSYPVVSESEAPSLNGKIVYNVNKKMFLLKHNEIFYKIFLGNDYYNTSDFTVLPGVFFCCRNGLVFNNGSQTIFQEIRVNTVDDLNTDSDAPLSARQGLKIKELIDDGYKFFGIINNTSTIQKHSVKGFYILYGVGLYSNLPFAGGGCPDLAKGESGICTTEDNVTYNYFKLQYATKDDLQTITDQIEGLEITKTKVLTEAEYESLSALGKLEDDRFYFTFEE